MPQLYDRHIFYVRWHMLLDEGHSDFHTYSHQIRTPDCVPVHSFPSPRIYTSLIQSQTWHTAVRVDTSTTRISSPLKREMFIRHRRKNGNKKLEWQKFTENENHIGLLLYVDCGRLELWLSFQTKHCAIWRQSNYSRTLYNKMMIDVWVEFPIK